MAAVKIDVRALVVIKINDVEIPCGRVVKLLPDLAAAYKASGDVDDHVDAVAYALTENADIITV